MKVRSSCISFKICNVGVQAIPDFVRILSARLQRSHRQRVRVRGYYGEKPLAIWQHGLEDDQLIIYESVVACESYVGEEAQNSEEW